MKTEKTQPYRQLIIKMIAKIIIKTIIKASLKAIVKMLVMRPLEELPQLIQMLLGS